MGRHRLPPSAAGSSAGAIFCHRSKVTTRTPPRHRPTGEFEDWTGGHCARPDITGWPVTAITEDLTPEGRWRALETGPYGRYVWHCDNNVVDHQTVNMQFPGGATVTLLMHGHAYEESRTMRYDGTRATLRGKFEHKMGRIEVYDHLTGRCEKIDIGAGPSGHGGGDFGLVRSFVRAVRGEDQPLTTGRESLESHLMAFAAETSRLRHTVIEMTDYRVQAEHV